MRDAPSVTAGTLIAAMVLSAGAPSSNAWDAWADGINKTEGAEGSGLGPKLDLAMSVDASFTVEADDVPLTEAELQILLAASAAVQAGLTETDCAIPEDNMPALISLARHVELLVVHDAVTGDAGRVATRVTNIAAFGRKIARCRHPEQRKILAQSVGIALEQEAIDIAHWLVRQKRLSGRPLAIIVDALGKDALNRQDLVEGVKGDHIIYRGLMPDAMPFGYDRAATEAIHKVWSQRLQNAVVDGDRATLAALQTEAEGLVTAEEQKLMRVMDQLERGEADPEEVAAAKKSGPNFVGRILLWLCAADGKILSDILDDLDRRDESLRGLLKNIVQP